MPVAHQRFAAISRAAAQRLFCLAPLIALAGCAALQRESALESLLAAERGFAQQARDRGVREAFLANFAGDGIAFEPAPVKLRATWAARPVPTTDVRVAPSADMAVSYGRRNDAAVDAATDAYYTHLWLRDAQGRWRIAYAILP